MNTSLPHTVKERLEFIREMATVGKQNRELRKRLSHIKVWAELALATQDKDYAKGYKATAPCSELR